jgi:hypothetical protein
MVQSRKKYMCGNKILTDLCVGGLSEASGDY